MSHLKVLVVEDEETWQQDLEDAIRSFWDASAEINIAADPVAVAGWLNQKVYDLAIVDLSLSGTPAGQSGSDKAGLEVVKMIRQHPRNQSCAVVIHTGYDKASVMRDTQQVLGYDNFVKVEDKNEFAEIDFVEKLKAILKDLLPGEGLRPKVFVSYARENAEFVSRLVSDLESAGCDCWIDRRDIRGGDDAIEVIAKSIDGSDILIVIVTRTALQSEWVRDEILWARKKNKLIIPLILENVSEETGFFLLNRYQPVEFDGDYANDLSKLLRSLMPGLPSKNNF